MRQGGGSGVTFFWRGCRFDSFCDIVPRDEYSDLRKAYAKAVGCTLRTAQRHEGANHPDWQKFIGKTAAAGVRRGELEEPEAVALSVMSPMRPEERPAFFEEDESRMSREQVQERRAWELWDWAFREWKAYIGGGMKADPVVAMGYARALPAFRENYEDAAKKRRAWEIENRRLIQAHEFEAFVAKFLLPLAELIRNLSVELPMVANPDNPNFARERLLEWQRTKAEPLIAELVRGSGEFTELPA